MLDETDSIEDQELNVSNICLSLNQLELKVNKLQVEKEEETTSQNDKMKMFEVRIVKLEAENHKLRIDNAEMEKVKRRSLMLEVRKSWDTSSPNLNSSLEWFFPERD